jgi:uncharacterized protein (DUF779 family)
MISTFLLNVAAALSVNGAQPMNCVNPGGYCNGTVPCCSPNTNFCIRSRCAPSPAPAQAD